MTIPAIIFSLLSAFFVGALYHFLRGGGGWRLFFYLFVGAAGFFAGQWIGSWRGWRFLMIGEISFGTGALFEALFLVAGEWLSRVKPKDGNSV
jgi:hypothetical protein